MVDFKFLRGRYEQADDKRQRLGIEGNSPNLVGERLSLEKETTAFQLLALWICLSKACP